MIKKTLNKDTQKLIKQICNNLAGFLVEKNKRYGDSALKPRQTFYKGDSQNSILIRLDDKLNRIQNADRIKKNDCLDLTGYLILLMANNDWIDFSEFLD